MKQSFSRFFGIGDNKEIEMKDQEEETNINSDLEEEQIRKIKVDDIIPNRFQPRTIFDDEKIEQLARTIHTHGIIQPIVVREYEENKFELIAGERRWRAIKQLGWETIPAIINNLTDTETASVALIENLQREELSPIEEAVAYYKLIELHNLTQEALAQRLGKGQSTIANKLRLLKLPEEIQQALLTKQITERHARALLTVKDEAVQLKIVEEIIEKGLNVKQTEERIAKIDQEKVKKERPRRRAISKDMRIALNTIRQSLTMVNDSGIDLEAEEEEHEEYYQFTIKIPKK